MAIEKKLIHFNEFSVFKEKKLSANTSNDSYYKIESPETIISGSPDLKYQSIVFIRSTRQIWTHGRLYDCSLESLGELKDLETTDKTNIVAAINEVNGAIPTNYLTGGSQTSTSTSDGGSNVFTFTKSDNSTATFTVKNGTKGSAGTRGSRITTGTAITGNSTTATKFTSSGITDALAKDVYINTSTGYVYSCETGGNASTATWKYTGSIKGEAGTAATITVGSVSEGTSAEVTNGGTPSAASLDFVIPRGSMWFNTADVSGTAISGTTANTDYKQTLTSACKVGDFFLNSYKLYKCTVGAAASAQSTWRYHGSIRGASGAAATITVGTVTSGTSASVTNSGTTAAAILDFTIPKGDTGATGQRGSKWFTGTAGSGTTTCNITLTEKTFLGDMYLDTDSSTVFTCTTAANANAQSTWTYKGSIKGGTGTSGAAGTSWIVGTALSVTSGTGLTPTANIPVAAKVGDLYLNSSSGTFYTCTTAGAANTNSSRWSYSGSIKGSNGSNASVSLDADQDADYGLLSTSLTSGSALTSATRSTNAKINPSTGNITTTGNITVGSKATMAYNADEDCITFSFT